MSVPTPPYRVFRHTALAPACAPCNMLMSRTSYSVHAGQTVWEVWTCFGCMTTKEYGEHPLRAAANAPLPLHRTEAGYPRCSTCDGGGCPDCTDPA